jgi:peptide/nickel transport system ATP-binding protein
MPLLTVRDLEVEYVMPDNVRVKALRGVSIEVDKGDVIGIVGESGSGKSTLAMAIMRMIKPPSLVRGSIWMGDDLLRVPVNEFNEKFRWIKLSMVPQASQNVLNPTMRILDHFMDTARAHGMSDKHEVMKRARELLSVMKLDPERVMKLYPHQLSGGMKQRIMIALAIFLNPDLVIMDEPTSALDVVTQADILDAVRELNKKLGITVLFITHDITVVSRIANKIAVMYDGNIVEYGPINDVLHEPRHPYTMTLISATPTMNTKLSDIITVYDAPLLTNQVRGCSFWPRCSYRMDKCKEEEPKLITVKNSVVRCHLYG